MPRLLVCALNVVLLLFFGTGVLAAEVVFSDTVLLYSNSPEKVTQSAILYSATITGPARLLFHHVNRSGKALVLEVRLQNRTDHPNGVAWRLYAYQHVDPTQAGHYAVKQFWLDRVPIRPEIPLSAYGTQIMTTMSWANQQTISGIAWLYAAEPTQVEVIARPASGNTYVAGPALSSAVFPLADVTDEIPYTLPRNPVVFSIGRGNFLDNTNQVLLGNYGVLHHYRIIAANPTMQKQVINIYSRQAGGVSRAFVQLDNELLPMPTSATYEKLLLATRIISPQSEVVINLSTMPQAGSNMPIDFILESGGTVP